jgi:hypothetical protein
MRAEDEHPQTFFEWVLALLEERFLWLDREKMSPSVERIPSMNSPTCTGR